MLVIMELEQNCAGVTIRLQRRECDNTWSMLIAFCSDGVSGLRFQLVKLLWERRINGMRRELSLGESVY